ncbi:MAG: DUF1987 domain-containing protein [Dokdonella sp.]
MNDTLPENLFIDEADASPEVDFRFSEHRLTLKGESYPENAASFYGEMIERTRTYLAALPEGQVVTIDVSLSYFNSSSTKMLFGLFSTFEEACRRGIVVILNWYHDAEDETMEEFGAELHDEYPSLQFNDIPVHP